jgi:hypothetical protein
MKNRVIKALPIRIARAIKTLTNLFIAGGQDGFSISLKIGGQKQASQMAPKTTARTIAHMLAFLKKEMKKPKSIINPPYIAQVFK